MSDLSPFMQDIVSRLGTPTEQFGVTGFLGLIAILAAFCAYLAIEYGFARLLIKAYRKIASKIGSDRSAGTEDS